MARQPENLQRRRPQGGGGAVAGPAPSQSSGLNILGELQAWLGPGDEVCSVLPCMGLENGSRRWLAGARQRNRGHAALDSGASPAEVEAKKKALEEQLQRDLERLAEERKEGLHRIDWQLAEAVENLHAETVRRANERVAQHKEILAELERRVQQGDGSPPSSPHSRTSPTSRRPQAGSAPGSQLSEDSPPGRGDGPGPGGASRASRSGAGLGDSRAAGGAADDGAGGSSDEGGGSGSSDSGSDDEPGLWGKIVSFVSQGASRPEAPPSRTASRPGSSANGSAPGSAPSSPAARSQGPETPPHLRQQPVLPPGRGGGAAQAASPGGKSRAGSGAGPLAPPPLAPPAFQDSGSPQRAPEQLLNSWQGRSPVSPGSPGGDPLLGSQRGPRTPGGRQTRSGLQGLGTPGGLQGLSTPGGLQGLSTPGGLRSPGGWSGSPAGLQGLQTPGGGGLRPPP